MPAMQLADTSKLTGKVQDSLSQFEKSNGFTPNVLKQIANSPAALEAFLSGREALSRGSFDEKMRAMIGITIAETYSCEYMLAARIAQGQKAGMTEEEIKLAKQQSSKDPKIDLGLSFVRNLVLRHAELPESDLGELKGVGFTDGEIVELIANVSFNMFAYYMIQIAQPELDFPFVATAFPA
jgi:alkylhydroperoxidase/carboxymuconolactone decarboxylase family protein YurZ